MKPTITCGKQLAEHADISGSVFHDVNLAGATFEDVNMSQSKMHNINLSDLDLSAVNLGGARIRHTGPAPDKDGRQARQRAVTFEEAMLCDSTFTRVDLSGVKIVDCQMDNMTIDRILVADLLAAYHKSK